MNNTPSYQIYQARRQEHQSIRGIELELRRGKKLFAPADPPRSPPSSQGFLFLRHDNKYVCKKERKGKKSGFFFSSFLFCAEERSTMGIDYRVGGLLFCRYCREDGGIGGWPVGGEEEEREEFEKCA